MFDTMMIMMNNVESLSFTFALHHPNAQTLVKTIACMEEGRGDSLIGIECCEKTIADRLFSRIHHQFSTMMNN
jgi:hypothetical protein